MMTIMDRVLVKDNNGGMGFYEQLESQGIHISESQRNQINSRLSEVLVHRSLIDVALGFASVVVGFAKDIIIEKIKNPIPVPVPLGFLGRVKRFLFG